MHEQTFKDERTRTIAQPNFKLNFLLCVGVGLGEGIGKDNSASSYLINYHRKENTIQTKLIKREKYSILWSVSEVRSQRQETGPEHPIILMSKPTLKFQICGVLS